MQMLYPYRNGQEKEMLNDFGRVSNEARIWGMPLLAMIYPRGEKIKDEYDVNAVKHAARVGNEMGADIVKVSYTGSVETFKDIGLFGSCYNCRWP